MKILSIFAILLISTLVSAEKLKIDLMVESLCPDCLHTMTKSFSPAIDQGLFQIADVTFVPYGNATEKLNADGRTYSYTCQNTQDECYGNALYSCIQHYVKDKIQANNALVCMFTKVNAKAAAFPASLASCSTEFGFDANTIKTCALGEEGNALQHQAALATPEHHGVPWPVLEGKTLSDADRTLINENVLEYACKNYTGEVQLPACKKFVWEKVSINYFVDSLGKSSVYTVAKIGDAIPKGLLDLADVNFVFAGDAMASGIHGSTFLFTCTHGTQECYGNALNACIFKHATTRLGAVNSIKCMYAATNANPTSFDEALSQCAKEYISFDVEDVKDCAYGNEGNQLAYHAIRNTPAHTFIPWETASSDLVDAERAELNEDPLKWVCAHGKDSDLKTKICTREGYSTSPVQKLSLAKKPSVTYYIESLCPDCVNAMAAVKTAIDARLLDLVDVDFVLGGNAKVAGKEGDMYKFECQHGSDECYGNVMESCIYNHSDTKLNALKAITCMFAYSNTDGKAIDYAFNTCAQTYPGAFYLDVVQKCAAGAEGNKFSYDAIQKTPAHTFIPWTTVDGVELSDDDRNTLRKHPLKWACANAPDSQAKTEICAKEVRQMVTSFQRMLIQ